MKKISTTQLSKRLGLSIKAAFAKLVEEGFIEKVDEAWKLTDAGQENGGEYRESSQHGKYIVWPEEWADQQA